MREAHKKVMEAIQLRFCGSMDPTENDTLHPCAYFQQRYADPDSFGVLLAQIEARIKRVSPQWLAPEGIWASVPDNPMSPDIAEGWLRAADMGYLASSSIRGEPL